MLDRVERRTKLKPRREPYWHRLAQGRFLGFRRLTSDSPGNWIARATGGNKYVQKALGEFADLMEKQRFDRAKREAEAWFQHLDLGGTTERITVKSACEAYVENLRQEKGEAAAEDSHGRFRRLVYGDEHTAADPIAKIELPKLAPRHLAEWKKRVLAKGKARSYYNRNATALRAALNLAKGRREVSSDQAWAKELKPLEADGGRRTLYFDRAQRRRLIESASDELRPLVTAMALLPMRPGELVHAKVQDLDVKHATLRIVGRGRKKKERTVPLPREVMSHLKACARDKLPAAWLISRSDGRQWDRFTWRDEIKLAAARAKLPAATCLYTLRHSTITDLVTGGLDLFTVAKISGTSVAMIEKHYGHLQREHARGALEKLAL